MPNVFELTERPAENLFYKRNDPEDKRLGEHVGINIKDYEKSNVVIVGSPQDEGVKRNKGRAGAAKAPDEIRAALYKLVVSKNIKSLKVFDLGNLKTNQSLEEIHSSQEEVIYSLLKDNKKIIMLGGGNDISYPDCKALSRFNKKILALNIDSHFDVRSNSPRNSGTSYRMLLEEKLINGKDFFEIGIKDFASSAAHEKYLKTKGAHIIFYNDLKKKSIEKTLKEILAAHKSKNIFWGFDMDSVKSSEAPGVSAPSPLGLTADQAAAIASLAGENMNTKIFEISEVNPVFDIDSKTSKLAAIMIWHFLNNLRLIVVG
jgi:formiminoglutamase